MMKTLEGISLQHLYYIIRFPDYKVDATQYSLR